MVDTEVTVSTVDVVRPWYQTTGMLVFRWIVSVLAVVGIAASGCLAVVGNWSKDYLTETPRFVQTFEPLAKSEVLHKVIADQIGSAVRQQVLDNPFTPGLEELIASLTTSNSGVAALLGALPFDLQGSLQAPIEEVTAGLAEESGKFASDATLQFVTSSAFPAVWNQVVEEIHSQLVSALSKPAKGGHESLVLSVQSGPIIAGLKDSLTGAPGWLVSLVPQINEEVPVFQINDISSIRPWYNVVQRGGQPYVFVAAGLGALLLLIAPKRFLAVGLAGTATAVAAGVLALRVPTFGQDNFVGLSAETEPIATQVWELISAPLGVSLDRLFWVAVIVAASGMVLALIVALVRRTRRN